MPGEIDKQYANLDPETTKNLEVWLSSNIDDETRHAIEGMLKVDPREIVESFYTRLTFGTGGLRGVMGIGTNRMNIYTVGMATQGLVNYLKTETAPQNGHAVFIGYDSRENSRLFAEEAAKVIAANGMRAYLCADIRPTPFVSFGCRQKKCSAGIMITASHNPPQYNGYKVYGSDGGQVVAPQDKAIIDQVRQIETLSQVKKANTLQHPLIENVGQDLDKEYIKAVSACQNYRQENKKDGGKLKIVYTSLHGTGITLVPETLKTWGFTNVGYVEEQIIPDGTFPTAKSPNPEERSALQLGIQKLEETESDLLLATDPDADRVGVAIRHAGKTILLSGNQIACLAADHICKALNEQGRLPKNAAFVKTIATSELFRKIVESYGAACFDVLTGFKYIAEKIKQWDNDPQGYKYIFGGEESYGYLLGTYTRDKDAIISCALIAEMASHLKTEGKTLVDALYDIYKRFGVHIEILKSIKFEESKEGKELMKQGIDKIKNNPPSEILGVKVEAFEDYRSSIRTTYAKEKKEPILLPKTDAYLFWLADGTKLLVRPSGTEPKIKVYCGVSVESSKSVPEAIIDGEKKAENFIDAVEKLLQ